MTENTKAVECRDALVTEVADAIKEVRNPRVVSDVACVEFADIAVRTLARHLAQPAVPEGVEAIAVLRRMRSSEFVRLDRATKAEGRANANARIDALDTAIAALTTPQPAAQESAREDADEAICACPECGHEDRRFICGDHCRVCGTELEPLSTPQPESAQGERGAVGDFYGNGASLCEMHPDYATNAEILIAALCARLDTARQALSDAAAMQVADPKLQRIKANAAWAMDETKPSRFMPRSASYESTPTGDQNARAVIRHLDAAVDAVSSEHAPLTLNDLRLNGTPAPVAQVGDERLTVCIEGIGMAKMALMLGDPKKARERLDAVSDKLDALARTQENGHG